jgi:hypothetical protein
MNAKDYFRGRLSGLEAFLVYFLYVLHQPSCSDASASFVGNSFELFLCSGSHPPLTNQHTVTITIKAVAGVDRVPISLENVFLASEGAHQS